MKQWQGYLHFLWHQFTSGSVFRFNKHHANTLARLSSLRTLKEQHDSRVYVHESTSKGSEDDRESDDVWGFKDTSYRANADGTVEVTGSRYLLSGCKLPSLLPWASDVLGVEVPRQPMLKSLEVPIPEPQHVNGEFLDSLRQVVLLREDQMSREAKDRRRHGHGHTQEEMYAIKYGPGLARVPDVVVYPESETQVMGIVEAARQTGVCLIPYGGGTNVSAALKCPSKENGETRMIVSVDMRRMNKIIWIDPVNRLAEIEAGAVGSNIMEALEERGFTLGHEPDSCEFSTLGGWIATNASGMKKNRYGNIEDVVLDMRVVMPSGAVMTKGSTSVHPRESTGSNPLRYTFGSEGTLGIVVSAVVKLCPLPEATEYAAVLFPTWEDGVQFMYELRHSNCQPASVRLVDNEQFRMSQALKPAPSSSFLGNTLAGLKRKLEHLYILQIKGFGPREVVACTMVFEGTKSEVNIQEHVVKRLVKKHGGVNAGAENGRRGYQMRYNIAYIRDFAIQHYVLAESFETSVPWSQVLDLCDRVKARLRREHEERRLQGKPLVTCRVTQLYETGVAVYFYFGYYFEGVSEPEKVYAEMEEAAREEVLLAGGSLSHHHGVGKLRNKFLGSAWSEAALEWRDDVKRALDPQNVFGCGNLVKPGNSHH
ncbi:alkyl-dihydroxyacetonephosphate synthase [Trichoderma citrinoviride]|uniref:Alkylglycerone-phosphate synthase n=1 Tax=Trichoderma citrinoviride TaxID=58853 RepID=A0A2T4AYX9_9HYPO|nr:alkyl-dihydroxyacetonephosphate synthase [Trichoderma citrinoviride]PTB62276.1 alkyl-dihydroxyacetonephosphate synthase [Trichoderma citrinoviride]